MLFIVYTFLIKTYSFLYFYLIYNHCCYHSCYYSYCSSCCLHSILLFYCKFFKILLFFVTLEYYWLFWLILLVHLLDLFILLLDSYTITRSLVVIAYILTIFCIIMKNSLFLLHLSIFNCCCLLFILFKLKLIHSYNSVWSNIILLNILVNILIVLLVVYILYYYFTVNFSKSYFFCDTFAFLTLLVDLFLLAYLIHLYFC